MAIDTASKRYAMMNMANPSVYVPLFEVDGTVDADDRAHLLHLYGGNALNNPVAPSGQLLSIRHVRNHNIGISGGFR